MRKEQQLEMDFEEPELRDIDLGFKHCIAAVLQLAGFVGLIASILYVLNYYIF